MEPTIQTDLNNRLDYAGYLRLDLLLGAQQPLSDPQHHDEMLFIVQHQTSELWMKLIVHELNEAISFIQRDNLSPCFKILSRVKHIQRMLFEQWAVLETLTPSEYVEFRGVLGNASGFQSYSYRMVEFLLGNKDADSIQVFQHREDIYRAVKQTLDQPSIYDEFLMYLGRARFNVPAERLDRDWSKSPAPSQDVVHVFEQIYENRSSHWDAYEMCEKLVDVEEQFLLWRYRHVLTVERIIGHKRGTGGSSGVDFLHQALKVRLFPELWDVRTHI